MSKRSYRELAGQEQDHAVDLQPPTKCLQRVTKAVVSEVRYTLSTVSTLSPAGPLKRSSIVDEVQALEEHYAEVGLSLLKDLVLNKVSAKEFLTMSQLVQTLLDVRSLEQCSIKQVLFTLYPYLGIFITSCLKKATNHFGEQITIMLLDEYLKRLQSFKEQVKLCDFVDIWVGITGPGLILEAYHTCEFELGRSWNDKRLKDIDHFCDFANITWQFKSVKIREGSNRLVLVYAFYFVYHFGFDFTFEILEQLDIAKILVDGEQVVDYEFIQTRESLKGAFTLPISVKFGFNKVTGTNISLSDDTLQARRRNRRGKNALVFGSKPLRGMVEFEFEITATDNSYNVMYESLAIGIQQRPANTKLVQSDIEFDATSIIKCCVWTEQQLIYSNNEYMGYCIPDFSSVNLDSMTVGDRIGLQLTRDGDLSFFVNGTHKMLAAKNVYQKGYEVYPVVDVSNSCIAVKITRAVMSLNLQDCCVNVIAKSLHAPGEVKLLPLPKRLKDLVQYLLPLS